MRSFLFLGLVGSAAGLCAESCSGHGKCGDFDKCECYDNWTGPSCKDRVCPYTHSWAGANAHGYAECGNKGECDRGSGVCKCHDGYTGVGCDRLMCAGDGQCSGHGTCERFVDLNSNYEGWDEDKIMVCRCDPGYTGPSCESRMCKPGDDPMTPSGNAPYDIQEIAIDGDTGAPSGEFVLSYQDWRGEVWYTWALAVPSATNQPIAVEEALEALPNHAIPDVNVSHTISGNVHTWKVTFVSPHNTGPQDGKLNIWKAGCTVSGCQPYYKGLSPGACDAEVTTDTAGSTEAATCANRGTCDAESGICVCVDGFYGEACEKQTIIM